MTERRLIFGAAVRRRRLELDWTVERLARAVGTDPSQITKVEKGTKTNTLLYAWRYADALGVPLSEMIAEENMPGPDPLSAGAAQALDATLRALDGVRKMHGVTFEGTVTVPCPTSTDPRFRVRYDQAVAAHLAQQLRDSPS